VPLLINSQTRVAENLPAEEAQAAFLAGSRNVPSSGPVAMFNPMGELVTVDPTEVHDALTQGNYRLAGDDEVQDATNQQKYGEGLGNAAKAFGEGALRGASLACQTLHFPPWESPAQKLSKSAKNVIQSLPGLGMSLASGLLCCLRPKRRSPALYRRVALLRRRRQPL